MQDIAAVAPRGAGVADGDQDRADYLLDGVQDVANVWQAFQADVANHQAEDIIVCEGPEGVTYVVDGRDRVTALRAAERTTAPAEWVSPEEAERIIRSKTLRKHLSKGARAYMAAKQNPGLGENKAGNPSLKKRKSKSLGESPIVTQSQLEESTDERVIETHQALAKSWGVDRKLITQAYKIIGLLEDEAYKIETDPSYKPKATPETWVAKIFAGWGLAGIIAGITGGTAKETVPDDDAIDPGLLKLRAAVGSLCNRATFYQKLTGAQRKQFEADVIDRLAEAHDASSAFTTMLGRALTKAVERKSA